MSERYFALDSDNGLVTLAKIEAALLDAGLEVVESADVRKITARMAAIENKLQDNLRFARQLETKMDELSARRLEAETSRDHWIEAHAALTVRSSLERTAAKDDERLLEAAFELLSVAVTDDTRNQKRFAEVRGTWLQAYDDRKRALARRALKADKEGKTE